jgi:hypothetical protein
MVRIRRRLLAVVTGLALGATAALVPAPAHAAVADSWAFAYMDNPTPPAGWVMDTTRQWGTFRTTCGPVWATVTEWSVGLYEVTFPCTSAKGIVHVTAVDDTGRYCTAGKWGQNGTSTSATVFCFDRTGRPDHATFTILSTTSSGVLPAGSGHGYVFASPAGAVLTQFNSTGGANTVTHAGTGVYLARLSGLANASFLEGDLQVTAVHPNQVASRCKIGRWGLSGLDQIVYVICFDRAGNRADTWWNLSYHNRRTVLGALGPPRYFAYNWANVVTAPPSATTFNSAGGANSIVPVATGEYVAVFEQVGYRMTHIQVTTYGTDPGYCQLSRPWILSGSTVIAKTVICFDGFGNTKDAPFFISYTSNV